ncbi:signal recognition particle-docking protein FtsY [Roseofilum casamattae]|uniref:Signal recognition particle receptor FtsY n=1 Tax=Roseofilum casamattae BLCC-M143 TaxID=3022442 RepID=A0ABT7C1B8_9CYAN|nr:signal recognition particle-docking protein FtsY [Roseofilum casamattae]MDJ1185252.1 signal recognition particle-docking protein FtsY [Roseofilum casamattae BLCC-M143]
MVFNWFRRQFNRSDAPAQPSPEPETPAETTPAVEEPKEEPAEAVDYLAWAKAAYQNVQQQQAAEVEEDDVEEAAEEVATETAEEITEPEVIASAEEEEAPATAEVLLAEETEITAAEEAVTSSETDEEPTTVAETEEVEEVEETAAEEPIAPMSFLDRAKAEREGRLEELKERAVDEPVPLEARAAQPVEEELDEDFLWSARVLADGGRRPDEVSIEEINWLQQLRQGLGKTRRGLINQLKSVVGQGPLNEQAVMEVESLLLQADVGVEATDRIIEQLQSKLKEESLPPEAAIAYLKQLIRDILDYPGGQAYDATFAPEPEILNIWLLTGVNGAGKTTTVGKLAYMAKQSDYRCLIAAADTFRAAAVEQVKVWAERTGTEAIANPGKNIDPAAVVYDAIAAAQARDIDLLLVDTAGRLQNKKNLMAELSKIRRIIDKKAPGAKVESLLVLDATLGQNGLRQAQVFTEAAQLSGVVLTKLDGTAKGGVALAVSQQLGLPIRFIGAGEGIEDLRPFSSYEFVEALISG